MTDSSTERAKQGRPPVPTMILEMRSRAADRAATAPWYARRLWRRRIRSWDRLIARWEGEHHAY